MNVCVKDNACMMSDQHVYHLHICFSLDFLLYGDQQAPLLFVFLLATYLLHTNHQGRKFLLLSSFIFLCHLALLLFSSNKNWLAIYPYICLQSGIVMIPCHYGKLIDLLKGLPIVLTLWRETTRGSTTTGSGTSRLPMGKLIFARLS